VVYVLTFRFVAIGVPSNSTGSEGSIFEDIVDHTAASLARSTENSDSLLGHVEMRRNTSEGW
jgi:hypothetical protein